MWKNPTAYLNQRGSLFLGQHEGHEIGIKTERHAITVAGAGAGKGTCVIIPNLLKWPHNALVIDPKGEAAEATTEARERMGQRQYVLDPFQSSNIADRFKASYNPLDEIDPHSFTIKEDIEALADGIVMRPDPHAAHWDDGALAIIAGLIAYVKISADTPERNLIQVRKILRTDASLKKALEEMEHDDRCAGIMQQGAASAFAKEGDYFVSNARKNTAWLDSKGMADALSHSTFSLNELKNGKASVFLVLPANYLGQHGRFLRLFVRSGIEAMARKTPSNNLRGEQCLFLLDEFFSLGYIDEISKAAGLMRGYGLQLWPILQDLGQLVSLYGREGAETFFGNADIHQFFGNTDHMTLEQISARLGVHDMSEIPLPPPTPPTPMGSFGQGVSSISQGAKSGSARVSGMLLGGAISSMEAHAHTAEMARHQDAMNTYQRGMAKHGRPRFQPDQVAEIVKKKEDAVANNMICFVYGREALKIKPAPFFRPLLVPPTQEENTPYSFEEIATGIAAVIGIAAFLGWLLGAAWSGLAPIQGAMLGAVLGLIAAVVDWLHDREKAKEQAAHDEARKMIEDVRAGRKQLPPPSKNTPLPAFLQDSSPSTNVPRPAFLPPPKSTAPQRSVLDDEDWYEFLRKKIDDRTAKPKPKKLPLPSNDDPLAGLNVGWQSVLKDVSP